jgi:hypothetical protein
VIVVRDGLGYRERHGKGTLIPCFLIMIVLSLSMYYILSTGMGNNGPEGIPGEETYNMHYELYSETYDVSGRLTIYDDGDAIFEVINVDVEGNAVSIKNYTLGTYKVYYLGTDNEVEFGPVIFEIQGPDMLLVDRDYVGIRLTVMVL